MIVLKKNHYIAAIIILILTVVFAAWRNTQQNTLPGSDSATDFVDETTPAFSTLSATEKGILQENTEREMLVGVWFPYMSFLSGADETEFKASFQSKLDAAKEMGVNAVFVHVRPFADSLYPSVYEPWSHVLTGEQGKDPGYDPLQYMVEAVHNEGMEFHAWINPLRISTGYTPDVLSEKSFYMENKDTNPFYFMEFEGGIYYNPASMAIRERIASGVVEIVEKYDVDGIHFDDYFYPSDAESMDKLQYDAYCEGTEEPIPLHEWRTANINALIASVYRRVKEADPDVVFGISPQGNLQNNEKINADVQTWCVQKGYIDYICPQLYYSFENETLPFETALEQWCAMPRDESVRLYIGLAVYKAGTDADNGTWEKRSDILARQIRLAEQANADGIVLYAVDDLLSETASAEVEEMKDTLKEMQAE